MKKFFPPFIFLVFSIFLTSAHAIEPSKNEGLQGVTVGKVVWDISMADPKKLLPNLRVMRQTYDDLEQRGIKPEMVFAFRGPVVKLLVANMGDLSAEDRQAVDGIQQIVQDVANRSGVDMLACGISTKAFGVSEKLLPEIKSVSNSFLTLIGYQTKGYALIAIQ